MFSPAEKKELFAKMDEVFSSDQEKSIQQEINKNQGGEWIIPSLDNKQDEEVFARYMDMLEMSQDMDAYDCERTCHDLFAKNPWCDRSTNKMSATEVNRRSEFGFICEVSVVGDDYSTAESDYGKVFIPRKIQKDHDLVEGDMILSFSQFKGFESTRQEAVPWRMLRCVPPTRQTTWIWEENVEYLM